MGYFVDYRKSNAKRGPRVDFLDNGIIVGSSVRREKYARRRRVTRFVKFARKRGMKSPFQVERNPCAEN